jgi:F0F1-type ATP synthase epsilon subunit
VISTLRPGIVEVVLEGADTRRLFVKGGIVELDGAHLTILAERALEEAMDAQSLAAELEAARAELAAASDDTARLAAASALEVLGARPAGRQ